MKEWNPKSFDDINDTLRNYDLYLNFIDVLKTAKQIQPETIIVEQYIFEEIERIIKNEFIDDFNEAIKKIGIEKIIIKRECKDSSYYQIYYNFMDRSIYVEPYYEDYKSKKYETENKEENNMLKILEIYKEKKTKEIEQKYDEQLLELECNDPVNAVIEEAEEKLREMLETDKVMISVNSDTVNLTPETIEKRKAIIDIIHKEKEELNNVIREIEALLEFAPNYEESTKILLAYDIIDKKGKIK